jgi:phage terminase small subunit
MDDLQKVPELEPCPIDPENDLAPRQKLFAELYVATLDRSGSAIKAGYSPRSAMNQAHKMISEKVRKYENIQKYIAWLKKEKALRVSVDAEYILEKLKIINDARIEDYVEFKTIKIKQHIPGKTTEWDEQRLQWKDFSQLTDAQRGAIQAMRQTKYGIEIKLFGKEWSLDMVAKHIGFYEKDNKQKTEGNGVAVYLPDNGRTKETEGAAAKEE